MKVLYIHNNYQQKGGEDTVFHQELALISQTEKTNSVIFKNYSGVHGSLQFALSIWNIFSAHKINKVIHAFNPDIVHVHNWHYAIGPLIVRSVKNLGIPIVLTVQNFRLICPSATLLHKGALFTHSLNESFPWKAIKKKVYRNSFIQTFWLALFIWVHKKIGTWKMVDRFIVQTELAKNVFLSSKLGVIESQFTVKPNFIEDPGVGTAMRENFFLFIGRLAEEKGIDSLLETFKKNKYILYIGGDGPYKEKVIAASKSSVNIQYLGLLNPNEVKNMLRRCSILIFPSIWYEGMPMTLIEAFAAGTPVIASNLGAMASMIRDGYNGLHFKAGNSAELSEKVAYWGNLNKTDRIQFSENARTSYETIYTPNRNRELLLSIYNSLARH